MSKERYSFIYKGEEYYYVPNDGHVKEIKGKLYLITQLFKGRHLRKLADPDDEYLPDEEDILDEEDIPDDVFYSHPKYENYAANKRGEVINVDTGEYLDPKPTKVEASRMEKGKVYKNLSLTTRDKKKVGISKHKFVHEVFRGITPKNKEIDHRDNNSLNNKLENLRLINKEENIKRATQKSVIAINEKTGEEKQFESANEVVKEFDVSNSTISTILTGKRKNPYLKNPKDGQLYTFKYGPKKD